MNRNALILMFATMILMSCEDAAYYNFKIKNESTHSMILLKNRDVWTEDSSMEQDSIILSALSVTDLSESGTQPDNGEIESFERFDSIIVTNSESLYLDKSIKLKTNWKLETDSRGMFNQITEYNYEFVILETDLQKKEE